MEILLENCKSLMLEILVSLAASDLTELHVQWSTSVLLRLHFVGRKIRRVGLQFSIDIPRN